MNEYTYYEETIRWNPVTREEPPTNRGIYVYGPSFGRQLVRYKKDWGKDGKYVTSIGSCVIQYRITHWAELPNTTGIWPS
jgi:hypothetical protein